MTSVLAQPQGGDWEFTLGGSGDSNSRFSRGGFGLNGSAGYFLNPNIEFSLRQGVSYDAHAANEHLVVGKKARQAPKA